jgi:hypothetical protein
MHLRPVSLESDGDDDGGPTRSPSRLLSRRTSSSLSSRKQSAKNDLHGSQHSERSSSKQNGRSSAASQKSKYTQSSQDTRGVEEYSSGGTGGRLHNSQQPQTSSQFHGAQYFQNPHPLNGSSLFSTGSSMSSRQSTGSQNDNFVPATPVASNKTNRGSSRRSSKMMVQSTPVSQMSSPVSKSSRRSNPQTPPGSASPSVRKVKPRKKPLDETQGTYRNSSEQDRSTSTRTSYAANSFSLHSSDDRNFSSDDGGDSRLTRERGGSPSGKKRRPKAAGEAPPSSPTRRKSSVTIPQSPQRTYSHSSGAESPVQTSPNNGKVLRRKKRRPKKPGEPDSPGGRPGGNADFHDGFESTDSAEKDVSTDDELHAEPRRNPPPRRAKRRPTKSSENLAPHDSSRAHYSPAREQTSPMQHPYSSTPAKHPPTRTQSLISTSDEELRIAPSRRISFDTYFTQSSAPTASSTTRLYEFARRCQWDDVMRECEANPRDAKIVGEKDGTTALHLAIMSRTNPMMRDGKVGSFKPASLDLIEKLVEACPEAGSTRCTRKRYTPLAYACLVADVGFDMDDSSEMVLILMKHAPGSVFVFTDDGFSAVDIHILSYSQIHKQKQEVYSGGRTSSVVVRTLLAECPELAESRIYRHKVRGPIELLYRCNTSEFQDAMIDDLTGDASDVKKKQLKSRFGSVASVLSDWWAWKWVLLLLKFSTVKDKKPGTIFSAVQAAARLVACPLPILALAINTFPHQVEDRDPRGDIYNVSTEVCWRNSILFARRKLICLFPSFHCTKFLPGERTKLSFLAILLLPDVNSKLYSSC